MTEEKLKILLVEDSAIAARLITLLLKEGMPEESYELFQSTTLTEAIEITKRENIQIVLLDLGLPESQGLDTFKHFFGIYPHIPVIVLTGNEDKSLALKAVREGAQDYLVKGEVYSTLLARSVFYAVERGRLQYEKMLHQEELRRYSEQLEVLNATKDKFFSIIAHDLKSPFNSFLGNTEVLAEDLDIMSKEEIRDFVDDLRKSANNLFKLLENLLTWAQVQRGTIVFHPEPIELHHIVDEVFALYKDNAVSKSISLINLMPEEKEILTDHNMLYMVLRNLVYNSIKFTGRGGMIEVGINEITGFSELFVRDNGVGITDQVKAKLFKIDKQNTTLGTDKEKGTGLGLVLIKEMVEKNGGTVRVESEPGKGTTFFFTVPSPEVQ